MEFISSFKYQIKHITLYDDTPYKIYFIYNKTSYYIDISYYVCINVSSTSIEYLRDCIYFSKNNRFSNSFTLD